MNTKPFKGHASFGSYLMAELLDEIKNLRTLWPVTPAQMQQETIDRLGAKVDAAVRKGVKEVFAAGAPSITVRLKKITVDSEDTSATITFGNDELHALTDMVGSDIVLVLSNPEDHAAGVLSFKADAEQPSLPLD